MRMPLAAHRASMSLGFGAFTTRSPSVLEYHGRGDGIHRDSGSVIPGLDPAGIVARRSQQVATQHERGRRLPGLVSVIALAPADFAEAGALVEPARRHVVVADLE